MALPLLAPCHSTEKLEIQSSIRRIAVLLFRMKMDQENNKGIDWWDDVLPCFLRARATLSRFTRVATPPPPRYRTGPVGLRLRD